MQTSRQLESRVFLWITELLFLTPQVFWSWMSPRQVWTASRPTTWWSHCPAWPGETVWSCCQSTSPGQISSSCSTSSSCCRRVRPFTVALLGTWYLTSLPWDTPARDTATPLISMVSVCVCRKLSKQRWVALLSGLFIKYLRIHASFCWCVCPVDLISIDRRSLDREAECLERALVLAEQFMEKVRDTEDHMWKPAGTDMPPTERYGCVSVWPLFSSFSSFIYSHICLLLQFLIYFSSHHLPMT